MRTLTVLFLALITTSAFANFGHWNKAKQATETKYAGQGTWQTNTGEKGTWTNKLIIKKTSSDGESLQMELSESLRLLKEDGSLLTELSETIQWDFNDANNPNQFSVSIDGSVVGRGLCQESVGCTYFFEKDGMKTVENLYPNPENGTLEVTGLYQNGEERGQWSGFMKVVQ